jgi:hypothetical protein
LAGEILTGHETDKAVHGYLEVYDRLITNPKRLLEIGVNRGASLRLWQDMWPDCEVHGVELFSVGGVVVHVGDAYTYGMVQRLPGPFDVIIDDGSHTLASQLFVVEHYTRLLAVGGVLVVEDIPDETWIPRLAERVPEHYARGMFAVDRRMVAGAPPDSLLFVVLA